MASVWAAAQKAIYAALVADAGVHGFVADRIYDGVPAEPASPFVAFGPSDVVIEDDACGDVHRQEVMQIEVWSSDQARLRICKQVCDAVKAALHRQQFAMDDGAMVVTLVRSMAVRPDPDGIIAQGLVSLQLDLQEQGGA